MTTTHQKRSDAYQQDTAFVVDFDKENQMWRVSGNNSQLVYVMFHHRHSADNYANDMTYLKNPVTTKRKGTK